MNYDEVPLTDNKAGRSFEMVVDGKRAFIDYMRKNDIYYLIHTEVPKALRNKGIAAALVEKTFKYLEVHNLKMQVSCKYILAYLDRHPGWERLLVEN